MADLTCPACHGKAETRVRGVEDKFSPEIRKYAYVECEACGIRSHEVLATAENIRMIEAQWAPKSEMPDCMQYAVLESSQLDSLIAYVNEQIKEGWKPLGGISVTQYETKERNEDNEILFDYRQAMTREASDASTKDKSL